MADASQAGFSEALYADFLLLGRRLLSAGAAVEAMECAAHALQIRPDAREAAQLCLGARNRMDEATFASPPAAAIEALVTQKNRLEQSHLNQLRGCSDSGDGLSVRRLTSLSAPGRQTMPAELRARLAHVRLMADQTGELAEARVLERIKALCVRHGVGEDDLAQAKPDYSPNLKLSHALHYLGNDLFEMGFYQDARQCYSLVLELDSDLLETYFNRSLASARLALYDSALSDIDYVLQHNPTFADAHYTRGTILVDVGEHAKAAEAFMRALAVDEDHDRARVQLDNVRPSKRSALSDTDGLELSSGHDN
jgi:tetratricopeptide (TPR) repeat protein